MSWVGEGRGPETVVDRRTGNATRVTSATLMGLTANDYVIPTEPRYRGRGQALLAQLARELGVPGYKAGKKGKGKGKGRGRRGASIDGVGLLSMDERLSLAEEQVAGSRDGASAQVQFNAMRAKQKLLAAKYKASQARITQITELVSSRKVSGRLATLDRILKGKLSAGDRDKFEQERSTLRARRQSLLSERQSLYGDLASITGERGSLSAEMRGLSPGLGDSAGGLGGGGGLDGASPVDDSLTQAVEEQNRLLEQRNELDREANAQRAQLIGLTQTSGKELLAAVIAAVDDGIGGFSGLGFSTPSFAGGVADYRGRF